MKYLSILLLFFSFSSVDACSVPPEEYFWSPKKLVKKAEYIFIGEAIEYLAPDDSFTPRVKFKVVKMLKGGNEEYFVIEGFKAKELVSDYKEHNEEVFWNDEFEGNAMMPGDCGAYGEFSLSQKYLIFSGDYINHPKAQELIVSDDDKWLKKISKLIN